jgi:hypothetical protein
MLRTTKWAMLAGLVFWLLPGASGQCLPAVCSLSFTLQSDASGLTLGGSGTNLASMSFGSMQAFGGAVPSGVTKTTAGSSWTISTPFDVKVTCTNLISLLPCNLAISTSYVLTAQLQSADASNTWKVGGFTLTNTSASILTSSASYGQVTAYVFALTVPFTESPGTISNHVNLVAIAN